MLNVVESSWENVKGNAILNELKKFWELFVY